VIYQFYTLMIIYNSNVMSTGILPFEYNSPLGVDPDTMVTLVITSQWFKFVSGSWICYS